MEKNSEFNIARVDVSPNNNRPNDDEPIDDDYKTARLAGEHGLNCTALYHCQFGDGFFDKFSYLA